MPTFIRIAGILVSNYPASYSLTRSSTIYVFIFDTCPVIQDASILLFFYSILYNWNLTYSLLCCGLIWKMLWSWLDEEDSSSTKFLHVVVYLFYYIWCSGWLEALSQVYNFFSFTSSLSSSSSSSTHRQHPIDCFYLYINYKRCHHF